MNTRYMPGDRVEIFCFGATHDNDSLAWRVGVIQAADIDASVLTVRAEAYDLSHDRYYMVDTSVLAGSDLADVGKIRFVNEHAQCTCHEPPRAITRQNKREEWAHVDDKTFADTFHVHVDNMSRDCDGPMEHNHTYQITSIHNCETRDDLWRALVRMEVTAHATKQEILIDGDEHTAVFSETTDEGFRNTALHGCDEPDCAHDRASQRDYYAEAMGY